MKEPIIVATQNGGKFKEINEILGSNSFKLVFLKELDEKLEIVEDGVNYEQNAYKKAKIIFDVFKCPVIAEDSGLEIEALSGFPGIFSARLNYSNLKTFLNSKGINFKSDEAIFNKEKYNDKDKCRLLLKLLKDLKISNRKARFVCVSVLYLQGKVFFSRGECRGIISESIIGDGGFGYDPVFYVPVLKKTFAQLSLKEKNKISHRAKALKKLGNIILKEVYSL